MAVVGVEGPKWSNTPVDKRVEQVTAVANAADEP